MCGKSGKAEDGCVRGTPRIMPGGRTETVTGLAFSLAEK